MTKSAGWLIVCGSLTFVSLTGCGAGSSGSAVPGHRSAANNAACSSTPVTLVDVGDDLRELWLGNETAATGKRTSRDPEFRLTFSAPVADDLLRGAVTLTGQVNPQGAECTGPLAAGPFVTKSAPLKPGKPVELSWASSNPTALPGQLYPREFSFFVFGDLSGMPSVEGPMAAGGSISLKNMSVDNKRLAVALVAGKDVSLSQGSVLGKVYYGGATHISADGKPSGTVTKATPIDFATAKAQLKALSDAIGHKPASGTVTVDGTSLTLSGTSAVENVFVVSADVLKKATQITVRAPAKAIAIVNVFGPSVTFANCETTLGGGLDAAHLFWNIPSATTFSLSSGSLTGTVLAPRAAATLSSGSLQGTFVAASVSGSSFSSLLVPFVGLDKVPVSILKPVGHLKQGCEYTLTIAQTPLDSAGHCLAQPATVTFRVAPRDTPPFERETKDVVRSSGKSAPSTFDIQDGINTPVNDMFDRYASTLGIDSGESFQLEGALRGSLIQPGLVSGYYQQYHAGVKVLGYGFRVEQTTDGAARSVLGKAASNLSVATVPSLAPEQAVSTALNGFAQPYPWVAHPADYQAPVAKLQIQEDSGGVFRLVWYVDTRLSGTPTRATVVDALTGAVVSRSGRTDNKVPPCPVDNSWQWNGSTTVPITVDTPSYCKPPIPQPDENIAAATTWTKNGTTEYVLNTIFFGAYPYSLIGTGADNSENQNAACSTSTTFDGDLSPLATAYLLVQKLGRFYDDIALPVNIPGVTIPGNTWHWIDGPGNAVLYLEVSSDPAWYTSPELRLGYTNPPDASNEAMMVLNPDVTATSGLPVIQPFNLGHEFSHLVQDALFEMGQRTLDYVPETGALKEGFGDLMGAMFAHNFLGGDQWCTQVICHRDIANPGTLSPISGKQYPDTMASRFYKVPDAQCDPLKDRCAAHQDSTIFSHWFYLLGQDAHIKNQADCEYNVSPLLGSAWPEDDRWVLAMRIVFTAFQQLGDNPKFDDMRAATLQVVGPSTPNGYVVAHAWEAVGVTGSVAGHVEPANESPNVVPGQVTLTFEEPEDSGPWSVTIAKTDGSMFVQRACSVSQPAPSSGPVTYVCDPVTVEPQSGYAWRPIPPWSTTGESCGPTYTFSTGDRVVEVFSSLDADRDPTSGEVTTWVVDWQGNIGLTYPDAPYASTGIVNSYLSLVVGTDPNVACNSVYGWLVTDPREAPQGFYVQLRGLFQNASEPDPRTITYYLAAQALDLEGNPISSCSRIPFRFYPIERPIPLSPGVPFLHDPTTPAFDPGQEMDVYWTSAGTGATYSLVFAAWDPMTGDIHTTGSEPLTGSPPPAGSPYAGNANVLYAHLDHYYGVSVAGITQWKVDATSADGKTSVSSYEPIPAAPDGTGGDDGQLLTYYVRLPGPTPLEPTATRPAVLGWFTSFAFSSEVCDPANPVNCLPTIVEVWRQGDPNSVYCDLGGPSPCSAEFETFRNPDPDPNNPPSFCWSAFQYFMDGSQRVNGLRGPTSCFQEVPPAIFIDPLPDTGPATVDVVWRGDPSSGAYQVSYEYHCEEEAAGEFQQDPVIPADESQERDPVTGRVLQVKQHHSVAFAGDVACNEDVTVRVCAQSQEPWNRCLASSETTFKVPRLPIKIKILSPASDPLPPNTSSVTITWSSTPLSPNGYTVETNECPLLWNGTVDPNAACNYSSQWIEESPSVEKQVSISLRPYQRYSETVCQAKKRGVAEPVQGMCDTVVFDTGYPLPPAITVEPLPNLTTPNTVAIVTWRAYPGTDAYRVSYSSGCSYPLIQRADAVLAANKAEEVDPLTGRVMQVRQAAQIVAGADPTCDLFVEVRVCTIDNTTGADGACGSQNFVVYKSDESAFKLISLQITNPPNQHKFTEDTAIVSLEWVPSDMALAGFVYWVVACDIYADGTEKNCAGGSRNNNTWVLHSGEATQKQLANLQVQSPHIYHATVCQATISMGSTTSPLDSTCQKVTFQVGVAPIPKVKVEVPGMTHCEALGTGVINADILFHQVPGATQYTVEITSYNRYGGVVDIKTNTYSLSDVIPAPYSDGLGPICLATTDPSWDHISLLAVDPGISGVWGVSYRILTDLDPTTWSDPATISYDPLTCPLIGFCGSY